MTNKELSAAVIKKLVDAGIPRKAFSIKTSYVGYSQSVSIYIKDLSVSVKRVEKLVSEFDRVRRCHKSFEILAGGNTFVFVQYDYRTLKEAKEAFLDVADKMIEKKDQAPHVVYEGDGLSVTYLYVGYRAFDNTLRIDVEGEERIRYLADNRYSLAEGLAVADALIKARAS